MEELRIRPEPAYRHTMLIIWAFIALLGIGLFSTIIWLVREDPTGVIVFSIFSGVFAVVMLITVLWIPFYVATLEYMIGERSVRMKGGMLWKRQVTVPFGKITNVDTSQGPLQRLFGIGTVHVQTAGAGGAEGGRAELRIAGVREFERIRDAVRVIIEGDGLFGMAGTRDATASDSGTVEHLLLQDMLKELRAIRELLARPRA